MPSPQNKKKRARQVFRSSRCCLCNSDRDDPKEFGDKLSLGGLVVHYFCMLFASGLEQKGTETEGLYGFLYNDIIKESKRGGRLRCSFCKRQGAATGCDMPFCRVMYHYPCGKENGILYQHFGNFRTFCQDHKPRQIPPMLRHDLFCFKSQLSCAICLQAIPMTVSDDTLSSPCCRNAWFHKDCIQAMAHNSGLHFFKCPLCNNKEEFQQEMLTYGIHLPDRDALWELEPGAFQELYERHNRCDVDVCKCTEGRDCNNYDTDWELMLCDICGSQGTHLACSNLTSMFADWICTECSEFTRKGESDSTTRVSVDDHLSRGRPIAAAQRHLKTAEKTATPPAGDSVMLDWNRTVALIKTARLAKVELCDARHMCREMRQMFHFDKLLDSTHGSDKCRHLGSVDDKSRPVGSVDDKSRPVGSVDDKSRPVGSVDDKSRPVGTVDDQSRRVGSMEEVDYFPITTPIRRKTGTRAHAKNEIGEIIDLSGSQECGWVNTVLNEPIVEPGASSDWCLKANPSRASSEKRTSNKRRKRAGESSLGGNSDVGTFTKIKERSNETGELYCETRTERSDGSLGSNIHDNETFTKSRARSDTIVGDVRFDLCSDGWNPPMECVDTRSPEEPTGNSPASNEGAQQHQHRPEIPNEGTQQNQHAPKIPNWLRQLYKEDFLTGRNLGSKLVDLCPGEEIRKQVEKIVTGDHTRTSPVKRLRQPPKWNSGVKRDRHSARLREISIVLQIGTGDQRTPDHRGSENDLKRIEAQGRLENEMQPSPNKSTSSEQDYLVLDQVSSENECATNNLRGSESEQQTTIHSSLSSERNSKSNFIAQNTVTVERKEVCCTLVTNVDPHSAIKPVRHAIGRLRSKKSARQAITVEQVTEMTNADHHHYATTLRMADCSVKLTDDRNKNKTKTATRKADRQHATESTNQVSRKFGRTDQTKPRLLDWDGSSSDPKALPLADLPVQTAFDCCVKAADDTAVNTSSCTGATRDIHNDYVPSIHYNKQHKAEATKVSPLTTGMARKDSTDFRPRKRKITNDSHCSFDWPGVEKPATRRREQPLTVDSDCDSPVIQKPVKRRSPTNRFFCPGPVDLPDLDGTLDPSQPPPLVTTPCKALFTPQPKGVSGSPQDKFTEHHRQKQRTLEYFLNLATPASEPAVKPKRKYKRRCQDAPSSEPKNNVLTSWLRNVPNTTATKYCETALSKDQQSGNTKIRQPGVKLKRDAEGLSPSSDDIPQMEYDDFVALVVDRTDPSESDRLSVPPPFGHISSLKL